MPVSIHEIATKAGVSRMTVSRALRNHPEVSGATRDRILRLADDLGYRPNPLVSVWMAKVAEGRKNVFSPSLAFLASYHDDESRNNMVFRSGFFVPARKRANAFGFLLEEHPLFYSGMNPQRLSSILKTRACPGCIISPMEDMTAQIDFEWEAFSTVAIGYSLRFPQLHRVVVNHFMGMSSALEGLIGIGRKRVGLVLKELSDDRTNHLWTSSYLGFLWHHAGVPCLPLFVSPVLDRRRFADWFRANKPDAIIGADPEVIDWIEAVDRRSPETRCVFAHLHEEYADDSRIVGVVTSSSDHVAEAAIDDLIGQIKRNERGIPKTPRLTLIPCHFRFRHEPYASQSQLA